jgi:hypothetical protein
VESALHPSAHAAADGCDRASIALILAKASVRSIEACWMLLESKPLRR